MELIELENIAEREKINILNYKMNKTKSRIINYNNCYIFMDYSKIDSYTEEKCLLAEELRSLLLRCLLLPIFFTRNDRQARI